MEDWRGEYLSWVVTAKKRGGFYVRREWSFLPLRLGLGSSQEQDSIRVASEQDVAKWRVNRAPAARHSRQRGPGFLQRRPDRSWGGRGCPGWRERVAAQSLPGSITARPSLCRMSLVFSGSRRPSQRSLSLAVDFLSSSGPAPYPSYTASACWSSGNPQLPAAQQRAQPRWLRRASRRWAPRLWFRVPTARRGQSSAGRGGLAGACVRRCWPWGTAEPVRSVSGRAGRHGSAPGTGKPGARLNVRSPGPVLDSGPSCGALRGRGGFHQKWLFSPVFPVSRGLEVVHYHLCTDCFY